VEYDIIVGGVIVSCMYCWPFLTDVSICIFLM